ncbi:hypothetical protein ACQP1O_17650 [Nocardia sp. CA-151230]|uniref:hypothetical protein n=1 Tax=Nocardia sp. CA-151230 TaxID=3239982 RepID=UPI003D8E86E7
MKLKPLARNGFGILTAAAAASLALGAAPASADITKVAADCAKGGIDGPGCSAYIAVYATDSTPVWVTLDGIVLGGSPFPTRFYGASGYGAQIDLDCYDIPLHVVAMQKSANGVITSQMSTDYTPPASGGAPVPGLTGSAAVQAFRTGSTSGSAAATCHVASSW